LIVVTICLRLYDLGSDPPLGLSVSDSVYTDHPQYTLFARNFVETGNFTPFNDYRFVFFLKSSVTLLALIIFNIFGVGLYQSNLVGFLFALGAVAAFYAFVRKIGGPWSALVFLLLLCLDYNLLFFGRLPFLENSLAFFAFLAAVVMVYWERPAGFAVAGVLLAIGIFFGKVIGLVFLFPFGCYLLYHLYHEDDKRSWLKPICFAAGFVATMVFWYFVSYAPAKAQVTSYIGEQAFSLYGAPEGFRSVDDFIWKMVTFGEKSKLFERMRTVALLGIAFLAFVGTQVTRKRFWQHGWPSLNAGKIFIAAMIVAFYGSLMIWNYRPLRYQLVLIYAFYAAAAFVLTTLVQRVGKIEFHRLTVPSYILMYVLVLIPVYQLYHGIAEAYGWEFSYDENKLMAAFLALIVYAMVLLGTFAVRKGELRLSQSGARAIVVVMLLAISIPGVLDYLYWFQRPTFTIAENAHDLGQVVNHNAVISGPYGPLLTLDSGQRTVIHMFGVSQADPELFKKLPITHLLLDRANEDLAREDYPAVMDSAEHILTYHVGLEKARLFLVAGHTGNPAADRYAPTDFEKAAIALRFNESGIGVQLLDRFLKAHPMNSSALELAASRAENNGAYDIAEAMLKKSVEMSPTNYNLYARIGIFYKDRYEETGDIRYKQQGLKYFEGALKYAPTVAKIARTYLALKES
jgi:4-amino-4-deoxy-L-arabinose transferase-like glycosyltransferase